MEITALQRNIQPSEVPIEKLAGNSNISEEKKIAEVSRQFEAIFLRHMLNEANKPMFHSSLIPTGATTEIYQDMVTSQLADKISREQSFGFASLVQQDLSHRLHGKKQPATQNAEPDPIQL